MEEATGAKVPKGEPVDVAGAVPNTDEGAGDDAKGLPEGLDANTLVPAVLAPAPPNPPNPPCVNPCPGLGVCCAPGPLFTYFCFNFSKSTASLPRYFSRILGTWWILSGAYCL